MITATTAATARLTRTSSVIENGRTYKSASSSGLPDHALFPGWCLIIDSSDHAAAGPLGSTPVICRSRCNSSIGNGKTIVEFFSAAISVNVCR